MDDIEFEVLGELYFVTAYSDLCMNFDFEENELLDVLIKLASKGWIRVYETVDEEIEEVDLTRKFKSYLYLASKKGLLAHNRQ